MNIDNITFIVWIFTLPVWLIWETVVLTRDARTISQVARDRAWQLTAVVFFFSAMPFHWWCPVPWTGTTLGLVAFWSLQALLLIWNIVMWRKTTAHMAFWPRWLRWLNWPVWYLVLGPLAAILLFPQRQSLPWSP